MDYQANLDRETAKIRADAESDGKAFVFFKSRKAFHLIYRAV